MIRKQPNCRPDLCIGEMVSLTFTRFGSKSRAANYKARKKEKKRLVG